MGRQKEVPKPSPGEDRGDGLSLAAQWVPSFPPRLILGLFLAPTCHLHGHSGGAGSCRLHRFQHQGDVFAARHLLPQSSLSLGNHVAGPVPQDWWWQDLLAPWQRQAQVNDCPGLREKASGSLPLAPPWQTGSEGEEWWGRGEEESQRDRRGERNSTGQG